MSISKKVLDTIEEKHVEPKPKWQFLLKDWLLWFFGGFSIIIGSVAVSVMILLAQDFDWNVVRYSRRGSIVELFSAFPYLWGVILFFFVSIAYIQMKHTHTGYRYKPYVVVLVSVVISIVIGALFFFVGFGHSVDRALSDRMPRYNNMVQHKADRWAHPERGLLAGVINEIKDHHIMLKDLHGEDWTIRLSDVEVGRNMTLSIGQHVGFVGEKLEDNVFVAHMIRPWMPKMGVKRMMERRVLQER